MTCRVLQCQRSLRDQLIDKMDTAFTDWPVGVRNEPSIQKKYDSSLRLSARRALATPPSVCHWA